MMPVLHKTCTNTSAKNAPKIYPYLLVIFAAALLLPALGAFGILDPSDGLYAECAREMIERNDLITPFFNYNVFFEKPILIYWAIAAAYKVFGVVEWAARLPAAFCAGATVLATYGALKSHIGKQRAFSSALILLSMPLFCVLGHLALTDMMVTCFMTVAILCFYCRLRGGSLPTLLAGYGCLGLAILTKGPVHAVLSALIVTIFLHLNGPVPGETRFAMWMRHLRNFQPLLGIAIAALIAAPWYLYENSITQGAFFQEFFVRQILGRAAGIVNHREPVFYYVPYFFAVFFPWSLLITSAIPNMVHWWNRRSSKNAAHQLWLLSVVWLVAVLGVFSAVSAKMITYILPAAPPIAFMSALLLDVSFKRRKKNALLLVSGATLFASIVALFLDTVGATPINLARPMAWNGYILAALFIFFAGSLAAIVMALKNRFTAFRKIFVPTFAAGVGIIVPAILVGIWQIQDASMQELLRLCKDPQYKVALFRKDSPAAVFYLRREVPLLENRADIDSFVKKEPGIHLLLVRDNLIPAAYFCAAPHIHLYARDERFRLFSIDAKRVRKPKTNSAEIQSN